MRNNLQETAENVLGPLKRKRRKKWFDVECQRELKIRRRLKITATNDLQKLKGYEHKRKAKKVLKQKKRQYHQTRMGDLDRICQQVKVKSSRQKSKEENSTL